VDDVHDAGEAVRVTVSARVPPALAREIARLADAGDRSRSREVARAIRTYVEHERSGGVPPPSPGSPSSTAGRNAAPSLPADARGGDAA
jgi:Ribbon-helix-helix protein, copG family